MTNAQTVANQFGGFEPPSADVKAEIERLSRLSDTFMMKMSLIYQFF